MATIGSLGTDPDYASLYAGRHDPRLLMAQKLMELDKQPTANSTQSSFWANLLNQGGRGLLGGFMMNQVRDDAEKERTKQDTEAEAFRLKAEGLIGNPARHSSGSSSGGTAPPAPGPVQAAAPAMRADAGGGSLPPEQQQAIVTAATQGTMVPPHVLHALITQESNWNPAAKGKGSDFGLGQVTASTAANPGYGLPPLSDVDRADPNKNAAWAARYLEARGRAAGLTRPEDWNDPAKLALALRAYNGGGDPNYVANVTRHLRTPGKQADASPPPGSNIDALIQGVNQPKPRGIQLAAMLGNGNTATDAPTPILPPQPDMASVPDQPLARADPGTLANINGLPLPPVAQQPPPDAAAAAPYPPAALQPPPEPALVPQPDAAQVPPPPAAEVPPAPEPTPTIPNPQAGVDPGALANFNGQPQPAPAAVPLPEPPVVPQPPAAQVPPPAPAQVPPQYGPPPPRGVQLAKPLVSDNATEALNTASLAAARAGQNFVPGGPTGPQLAAPLQEPTTPDEAAAYSDARGPSGGPTGPQLAAPLQPPGSEPTIPATPIGAGGAAPTAPSQPPAPQQSSQDRADGLLALAREAAGSSNPRIRAYAGVLEAQAAMEQRRIDQQTGRADRDANRTVQLHDMEGPDGKVHTYRFMPDGTKVDQGLAANQRAKAEPTAVHTVKLLGDDNKEHLFIVKPDGSKTDLGPTKGEGSSYGGTGLQQQDSALLDRLHDKIKTTPPLRTKSANTAGLTTGCRAARLLR
jgi:hypothetical protein